jgi:hypothetical protein
MDYLHQCLNDFTLIKWPYMVIQFKFTHPWSKCTLMCIHIWLNFLALKFTMNVNEFSLLWPLCNLSFCPNKFGIMLYGTKPNSSCYVQYNGHKTHLESTNMFPLLFSYDGWKLPNTFIDVLPQGIMMDILWCVEA